MCITVGTCLHTERHWLSRLWLRLVSEPVQLFGIGATLVMLLGGWLMLRAGLSVPPIAYSAAILLFFMAGLTLSLYPRWSARSPIHYLQCISLFALFFSGVTALSLAFNGTPAWRLIGMALVGTATLLTLATIYSHQLWVPHGKRYQERILRLAFSLLGVSVVTLDWLG